MDGLPLTVVVAGGGSVVIVLLLYYYRNNAAAGYIHVLLLFVFGIVFARTWSFSLPSHWMDRPCSLVGISRLSPVSTGDSKRRGEESMATGQFVRALDWNYCLK